MGYYTRSGRYPHSEGIRCYEPDSTETEFYSNAEFGPTLKDALEAAAEHFKCSIQDLIEDADIYAEHIHTDCLGYDCYDSSDYTNYIRIVYNPPKAD